MIRTMADTKIEKPTALETGADETDKDVWKAEVDMYVKRKAIYSENKGALYSVLVWGQCSEAMRDGYRRLVVQPNERQSRRQVVRKGRSRCDRARV